MLTAVIVCGFVVVALVVSLVAYALATNERASHATGELPRVRATSHEPRHAKPTNTTRLVTQLALYTMLFVA